MDSTAKFMWFLLPKTRQAVPEGSDGAPKLQGAVQPGAPEPRARLPYSSSCRRCAGAAGVPMPVLLKGGVSVSWLAGWRYVLVPVHTCTSISAQGMVRRRGNRASLWGCSYRIKHSLACLGTAVTSGIYVWGFDGNVEGCTGVCQ